MFESLRPFFDSISMLVANHSHERFTALKKAQKEGDLIGYVEVIMEHK